MLRILYQDDDLVAIDKPAGLLVHRTGLDAGETRFAVQLLRDQLGQPVWPVHRLDKGTSGVLLFALSAHAASAASSLFESNDGLHKVYRAVVRGWPVDEGLIDHPLRRMRDDRRPTDRATDVQPARTRYRTLDRWTLPLPYAGFPSTRCALVELRPDTGRRHQLRRHCKHIAHPIIGDATHGKGPLNRELAGWLGTSRLWLHALKLELTLPWSGERLRIEAPVDDGWLAWARRASETADQEAGGVADAQPPVSRPASTNS